MTFSQWLRQKLDQRGVKPSELAFRSGISDTEISRLLSGKRNPSAKTLKKISPIIHCAEEDAMRAAGYLPPLLEKPKTIEIQIRGECPADKFNFAFEEYYEDSIILNFDLVKDKSAFGLKVKGDCLRDIGIFNGDIAIVSPGAVWKKGDIVVVRMGDECTMKKFYEDKGVVVLRPCNHDVDLIILDPKDKNIEIIGKVIKSIKNF